MIGLKRIKFFLLLLLLGLFVVPVFSFGDTVPVERADLEKWQQKLLLSEENYQKLKEESKNRKEQYERSKKADQKEIQLLNEEIQLLKKDREISQNDKISIENLTNQNNEISNSLNAGNQSVDQFELKYNNILTENQKLQDTINVLLPVAITEAFIIIGSGIGLYFMLRSR